MEKGNSLSVPIAIVIAGILIAAAVFFSNSKKVDNPALNQDEFQVSKINTTKLTINPVSTKDYIRGNPDAKVVIVEYSDTECPFCKQFHGTMKSLTDKLGKDGTIAWVYRNFPIKVRHLKAVKEAEALLCAGKVGGNAKFWEYTDRLYAITPSNDQLDLAQLPLIAKEIGLNETTFKTCLNSGEMAPTVDIDYNDAIASGGTGTPYNVFVVKTTFDRKEVEDFLIKNILQYRFPPELFAISEDNLRVSVSGAMPIQFLEELVAILSK